MRFVCIVHFYQHFVIFLVKCKIKVNQCTLKAPYIKFHIRIKAVVNMNPIHQTAILTYEVLNGVLYSIPILYWQLQEVEHRMSRVVFGRHHSRFIYLKQQGWRKCLHLGAFLHYLASKYRHSITRQLSRQVVNHILCRPVWIHIFYDISQELFRISHQLFLYCRNIYV